jgi:hypothetical protein
MTAVLDPLCERARAWASLHLDGDLSDLELVLLEDHLTRCAGCAAFVEGMRELTGVVRAASLERPSRPLVLPVRRRPVVTAVRVLAAAAVVALAAGLGILGSSIGGRGGTPSTTGPEIAFLSPGAVDREIKGLKTQTQVQPKQPVAPPGRQGGVV